jgi:transglutaminase-like putative cysteine protease
MSILASLHHVTRYAYDRPVALAPQIVRLRPAPHCRTRIESYSLKVMPAQHFVNWQQDPNGNWLARFVFPETTREFAITVDLVADMAVINPFDFFVEPFAETFPFAYPAEFAEELAPYLDAEPAGARLSAFLASIPRECKSTVDFLVGLNQRLQHEIHYLVRMETGVQAPEQTLALSAGSCRDSAWLQVQILRHLGLAARFVSGYLIQLRQARHRTSAICTPGPRSTSRAPAGSGSMPPRVSSAPKGICRSPPHRIFARLRPSAVQSSRRRSPSRST